MVATALGAMLQVAAAPKSAAAQNSLDCPPVARRDRSRGALDVGGPVLAQNLRETHGFSSRLKLATC